MKDFRYIDLNNAKTLENISVNDKIRVEDFGEEIQILVIRKDNKHFYGAYRKKTVRDENMININSYHWLPDGTAENYGADISFVENDVITGKFYAEHDALMKKECM